MRVSADTFKNVKKMIKHLSDKLMEEANAGMRRCQQDHLSYHNICMCLLQLAFLKLPSNTCLSYMSSVTTASIEARRRYAGQSDWSYVGDSLSMAYGSMIRAYGQACNVEKVWSLWSRGSFCITPLCMRV